jgi:hypothetical protein
VVLSLTALSRNTSRICASKCRNILVLKVYILFTEIVEKCPLPDVADRTELNKLVGQKILHAFDDDHCGWYIGTIAGTSLGARDLKQTPRANCVISYRRKETMVASLDGKVACELSQHLYGVDQWWVLLKRKA